MRLLLVPQKNGDNLNSLRWRNDCVWDFVLTVGEGAKGAFSLDLRKRFGSASRYGCPVRRSSCRVQLKFSFWRWRTPTPAGTVNFTG